MVHKCSYMKVLEVFFDEPTTIHFIKEISRRVSLAPTSVRKHTKSLLKEGLIKRKSSRPFDGFVANRDSKDFLSFKRAHNLYNLKQLTDFIVSKIYPKLVVVYGSYSFGEDIEQSDIDIIIVSKTKEKLDTSRFEKTLKRPVHLIFVKDLDELDENIKKKVLNGIVLSGGFDG